MTDTVQLDYAPAPPKRRKWIRRSIALVVVALIASAGVRWGPAAWKQTQILYWQRQCLRYTASPAMVVYEEEPTAAGTLIASDSQYTSYAIDRSRWGPSIKMNAAAFMPRCWSRFAVMVPGCATFVGPFAPGAIAFLHERTSPAGHRRLVTVRYFPTTDSFQWAFIAGYNYEGLSITPASLRNPPRLNDRAYDISVMSGAFRQTPNIRMYAGQIDPADSSHFTIRYEIWGKSDVLDGYLRDDDEVTLTPRKLPEMP